MPTSPVPLQDDLLLPFSQNWALKFPTQGPILGFNAKEVTDLLDDANSLAYTLGTWYPALSSLAIAGTSWKNERKSGAPSKPFTAMPAMPVLPAPPAGATFRAGARDRLVAAAARAKKSPNCTSSIEDDLQIGTPAAGPQASQPSFTGTALGGGINRLDWVKSGWTGVRVRMRRGNTPFIDLGLDLKSPFLDKTPLLVAGHPEIREYQLQYLNGDEPVGDWSDIVPVTTT